MAHRIPMDLPVSGSEACLPGAPLKWDQAGCRSLGRTASGTHELPPSGYTTYNIDYTERSMFSHDACT